MLSRFTIRSPYLARPLAAAYGPALGRTASLNLSRASPSSPWQTRLLATDTSASQLRTRDSEREYQPHPADTLKSYLIDESDPERPRRHEDWVLAHPVYTKEEVEAVKVVHAERKTLTDKFASSLVAFARWGFDFTTRYKEMTPEQQAAKLKELGKTELTVEEKRKHGFIMTLDQWMTRILFLETIAGVPGMVAGMLRHFRSLRRMERDRGFINQLLQEAENERMHLQTFIKIKQPSMLFRWLIIAAQGVFANAFFLAYMISPRFAHRFVGVLEEEAVHTYTQIIDQIKRGDIPEWGPGQQAVPQLAKDYWRMADDCTMLDLILAVRADEAGHRFMNHTCANLGETDFNPFAIRHATPKMQGELPGVSRDEGLEWMRKVEQDLADKMRPAETSKLSSSAEPSRTAPSATA